MSDSNDKKEIIKMTEDGLEREMDRLLAEVDPTKIEGAEVPTGIAAREVTTKFRKRGAAIHVSPQNIDDIDEESVARLNRVLRNGDDK